MSLFGASESSLEGGNTAEPKAQPVVSVAPQAPEEHMQHTQAQYAPPSGSYPVNTYPPQDQYAQYPQGDYSQQPFQQAAVSPSMSPVQQPPYPPPSQEHYQQQPQYPQHPQQ